MADIGQVVVNLPSQNGAQGVPEVPLLQIFLRGHPKTFGAVQIVIGGVMLMFGVELTIYSNSLSSRSGILIWGGLMFVTAGALSISADRRLTVNLVKASLGINIFSSITAMIGIVLHCIDLSILTYLCNTQISSQPWTLYLRRTIGMAAVMLILSLLELLIASYLCVFAYKATCSYQFRPKVEFVPDPPGSQDISTPGNSAQGQGLLIMSNTSPQEQN